MRPLSKTVWRFVLLICGVFIGAVFFLLIRAFYFRHVVEVSFNMGPEVAVYLSPVLAAPVAVFAVLVHLVLLRWLTSDTGWKWFLAGTSYATVLLSMISPWLVIVPLAVNPVSLTVVHRLLSTRLKNPKQARRGVLGVAGVFCLLALALTWQSHGNLGADTVSFRYASCPGPGGGRARLSRSERGDLWDRIIERPTLENVTAALKVRDPSYLVHYINSMRVYRNPEILGLWHDLWEDNRDKYPGLAWTCLEHPLVKITLAKKLADSDPENVETYRRYVEDNLDHDDRDVIMQAVIAVGAVGATRSIPRLEALALSEDTELAMLAIGALAQLRTEEAKAFLKRLYHDPDLEPIRKRTIREELGGESWETSD